MTRTIKPKSNPDKGLDLHELDRLLAVPAAEFDTLLPDLVASLVGRAIRVPTREEWSGPVGVDPRVSAGNVYQVEVQGGRRLEREEEFLMARRYAFLRVRARAALAALPLDEAAIEAALASTELPAVRGRVRARRHAAQALHELRELRNRYVEGSLYMVFALAHRYRNLGVEHADLVQEGNASLFQAIDGFDWRREVRFKTYAQYWIHQAILKLLYNASRTVRIPVWVQKTLKKVQRIREEARRADGREIANEEVARRLGMPVERLEELLATRRYAVSIDAELPGDEEGGTLSQTLADERDVPVPELVQDGNLQERLGELLKELPERESQILSRRFGLDGSTPETLGEIAADMGITAERVRQLQKAALARLQRPARIQRLKAFA